MHANVTAVNRDFPDGSPSVADNGSTMGIRPRVQPYTGTVDHDLPLYSADLLMGNPASGHFVR